jgi:hypothetical protein
MVTNLLVKATVFFQANICRAHKDIFQNHLSALSVQKQGAYFAQSFFSCFPEQKNVPASKIKSPHVAVGNFIKNLFNRFILP